MTRRISIVAGILFLVWGIATPFAASAQEVSLASLLNEMTDRTALARFPNPAYTCRQASSYDRGAVSPTENWFANADASHFLRVEPNGESVLMEADGPGAITRFWITAPAFVNHLKFYIDDNPEPVIAGKSDEIIGLGGLVPAPLSQVTARGLNLYLPIPYAKKIKVTCDRMEEQKAFYYQINYRTYPTGTPTESLTKEQLDALSERIAEVNHALSEGTFTPPAEATSMVCKNCLEADELTEPLTLTGPQTILSLGVALSAEDTASALRSTLLSITFDGEETVYCPVGDFFGSGIGVNPYQTWYTRVEKEGMMTCFWPMPFEKSAEIRLVHVGPGDVDSTLTVVSAPSEWSASSMYFHANWRQEREIQTLAGEGTKDWNYVTLAGKGVYVGDVLSLLNRDPSWWGEGDEKIYVDGETFPSHFGTGTEDYYGYAWGTPDFFDSPFRAQPRGEGPGSYGNVTNLRFRTLDAIPFQTDLRFDIEIWHWAATKVDYAVAAFWYGLAGATTVGAPLWQQTAEEAASPVAYRTPFRIQVEGFRFADPDQPVAGSLTVQNMASFGDAWKENRQLWWTQTQPGDRIELLVAAERENPTRLRLGLTAAVDYGVVQLWLDGEKLGEPIDLYNPDRVIHLEKTLENLPPLAAGDHKLGVEIIGKNEKSIGTMFGCDFVTLE